MFLFLVCIKYHQKTVEWLLFYYCCCNERFLAGKMEKETTEYKKSRLQDGNGVTFGTGKVVFYKCCIPRRIKLKEYWM